MKVLIYGVCKNDCRRFLLDSMLLSRQRPLTSVLNWGSCVIELYQRLVTPKTRSRVTFEDPDIERRDPYGR
jgi:hypothetical protein